MLRPLSRRLRKHRAPRPARNSRPRLEALEDRTLLAIATWDGGSLADSRWTTAANWVGDVAPSPDDDLVFPAGAQRLNSTNDFAAGTTFRSIRLTGAGYTLGGNRLTLTVNLSMDVPTGETPVTNTVSLPLRLGDGIVVAAVSPGSTLTLAGPLDNVIHTPSVFGSGDVTISGPISGQGGLVKLGSGPLTLAGNNSYRGLTWVIQGILTVASSTALGGSDIAAGITIVEDGATLQAAGGILTIAERLTLTGRGAQGGLPLSTLGALSARSGSVTWTGPISVENNATVAASGATFLNLNGPINTTFGSLTISSQFPSFVTVNGVISGGSNVAINQTLLDNVVTFTAANTYTGRTTVHRGTLRLTGNSSLASTDIVLNPGGFLELDNAATNLADRLPDTALLSLNGGGLTFLGNNAADAISSETVGTIELARGHSTIRSTLSTGPSATAELSAISLRRVAGATANFEGANLGTAANRIRFNTPPATVGASSIDGTGIVPFATVASSDFATYDATDGVRAFTGYVDSIAAAGPGDTVRLLNVSEVLTESRTINALFLINNGPRSDVTLLAPATLTLASGALSMHISAGLSTPAVRQPVTTAGGTLAFGGEGIVFSNVGILSDTIGTRIAGSDGLTIAGSSTLVLSPGVGVPVNLDVSDGLDSADLVLAYDLSRLDVVQVRRGRLTRDFDLFAVNLDSEAGTIRVGLGRGAGPISGRGPGSVLRVTFRIRPDAPAGAAVINLRHGVGQTVTQLNEGGLVLNPVPSDEAGDVLDGAVMVRGPARPVRGAFRPTAGLIDALFATSGRPSLCTF